MVDFSHVNSLIAEVEDSITNPRPAPKGAALRVGVDLGTAFTVLVVCDEEGTPLCCRLRRTDIVRDGLVVDYLGARKIVEELRIEAEQALGVELRKAAIAVPPGTSQGDTKTHQYVVEGAGMEVVAVEDEPTAANRVLNLSDGAVVDIGGGTTGISIFRDGKVVYTADEATGGTHFTYVISGHYKIPFDDAEAIKIDPKRQNDVYALVAPVVRKVASIINGHIGGHQVKNIVLCGGTACLRDIEKIIADDTRIQTDKPLNPFLVTPLGIALSCPVNN